MTCPIRSVMNTRQLVFVPSRYGVEVANQTGPLEPFRGKRVLIVADQQNLDAGARDLGFNLCWSALGRKLASVAARASLHVVFSRQPGDERRLQYFTESGWIAHAKTTRLIRRAGSWQADANADHSIAFLAGLLSSRISVNWVVVGTGDGQLAENIAEAVRLLPSSRPVATLSLAGSTAARLDARISDLIAANIEIGHDCLRV